MEESGRSTPTPPALCGQGPRSEPLPVSPTLSPLVAFTAPFLNSFPQTSLMKVPEDAWTPVVPTHCPASLRAVWATMTLESRAWDAICFFLLPRSNWGHVVLTSSGISTFTLPSGLLAAPDSGGWSGGLWDSTTQIWFQYPGQSGSERSRSLVTKGHRFWKVPLQRGKNFTGFFFSFSI